MNHRGKQETPDDDALTKQALLTPPPEDYFPSTSKGTAVQGRRANFLRVVGSLLALLFSGGLLVMSVVSIEQAGAGFYWCGGGGCRSRVTLVMGSALLTFICLSLFVASLGGRAKNRADEEQPPNKSLERSRDG